MFKVDDLAYIDRKIFRKNQKRIGRVVEIVSKSMVKLLFDDNTSAELESDKLSKIKNFADLFDKRADDPKLAEALARQMIRLSPKILAEDGVGSKLLKNNKFPKQYKAKIKEIMDRHGKDKR